MNLGDITITQFKSRFSRDFTYGGVGQGNIVSDNDITNAFTDAQAIINQSLYSSTANVTNAFLYLAAHCLCNNIKAANAGINGSGQGSMPVASKGAGSLNTSYAVPDAYKDDPALATYTQTSYGMKYLALTLPQTRGGIIAVRGGVQGNSDGNSSAYFGNDLGG